jgi:ubiquinone/menaquinone biosynthesis C-methylase UbiE
MSTSTHLDTMVAAYDELHPFDNQLTQDWYPQRVIDLARGSSLLELGMGHGGATSAFARHFARYQVVEGSLEMIERFRSRYELPQVDVHHGWFEEFDTDERFDHIGMGFVLEHVADPGAILRQYRRFLKPGGTLFAAVPNCESLHRRIGQAGGLLPDLTRLSDADLRFGHVRYYSLASLRTELDAAGWEVVQAEGIMLKPLTTQQLVGLQLGPQAIHGLMEVGRQFPELANSLLVQARLKPAAA